MVRPRKTTRPWGSPASPPDVVAELPTLETMSDLRKTSPAEAEPPTLPPKPPRPKLSAAETEPDTMKPPLKLGVRVPASMRPAPPTVEVLDREDVLTPRAADGDLARLRRAAGLMVPQRPLPCVAQPESERTDPHVPVFEHPVVATMTPEDPVTIATPPPSAPPARPPRVERRIALVSAVLGSLGILYGAATQLGAPAATAPTTAMVCPRPPPRLVPPCTEPAERAMPEIEASTTKPTLPQVRAVPVALPRSASRPVMTLRSRPPSIAPVPGNAVSTRRTTHAPAVYEPTSI
jgi:hypothetical protein